jgi:hypothetical protein
MARKSRDKGKVGEREIAALLREHGIDGARRGQQYSGLEGDSDVVGLPGIHIESKRTEALRLWEAYDQAQREARPGLVPTVWHRSSRRPWVVILSATDFINMVKVKDGQR